MERSVKDGMVLGTTFLVIHSFASFLVFLYCHTSAEGRTVFAYLLFFVVDAPTLPWVFEVEGKIGLLSGLADRWADLWYYGHHGLNLKAFILTTIFGGLHWFAMGNLLSYLFVRIQAWLQKQPT